MAEKYTPLEGKLVEQLTGVSEQTFNGSPVSFASTSSLLFALLYTAIFGAAFYRYVVAGIWRIEASPEGVKKSNGVLKEVTLGLLAVLIIPVLLMTINRNLLLADFNLSGSLGTKGDGVGKAPAVTSTTTPVSRPLKDVNFNDPVWTKAIDDDASVRAQLKNMPNGGITVNRNACLLPTLTACTTVGGLPTSTISMLSQLRSTCSGSIVITGGTEAGHSSHGPGLTPVDLSLNSPGGLETCIRAFPAFTPIPKWKSTGGDLCFKAYVNFGYVFCDEINTSRHWHVYKN